LRIKEQETRLTLQERDDDDDMYRTRVRCKQNKTRMNYDRKNDTPTEHMGDETHTGLATLTDITNTLTRLHNII